MLKRLYISNYAVIDELELIPGAGLNIITGETGAGKSILLDSLSLVFGEKADQSMVRDANEKVIVEAVFDISPYSLKSFFEDNDLDFSAECILRREVNANGKSRAFINDTPVTLKLLKELALSLVDVHRQFENTELLEAGYPYTILDVLADQSVVLEEFRLSVKNYKDENAALNKLLAQKEAGLKELEYWKFQLEDFNKIPVFELDIESLEAEQKVLENTEVIKSKLQEAILALSDIPNSAIDLLTQSEQALRHVSQLSETYNPVYERIQSMRIELKELIIDITNHAENTTQDPERLSQIEEWLGEVYRLFRKHSVQDIKNLESIHSDLLKKVSVTENLDELIAEKAKSANRYKNKAFELAKTLYDGRERSKVWLEEKMKTLLEAVGMKDGNFLVELDWDGQEINPFGSDHVKFMFSANKGVQVRELKKVASGGELSRILLCMKQLIANKISMPTLVFDEIDTGISGQTALQVAHVLEELGMLHQVIVISHLPQIASRGNSHFHIEKHIENDKTVSKLKSLTYTERISVLASMLGGDKQNAAALANAQELLSLTKN